MEDGIQIMAVAAGLFASTRTYKRIVYKDTVLLLVKYAEGELVAGMKAVGKIGG